MRNSPPRPKVSSDAENIPRTPRIGRVSMQVHRVGTAVSRRQVLLGAACACALPAFMRAFAESGAPPLVMKEVAPGIFFRRGVDEDASAANEGAIANIGFVIGREAVAVFDPGGSLIDGQRLLAAIRKTTPLPVRYVVLSHAHPDHIFGAGAFAAGVASPGQGGDATSPQFVGHARLPGALAARGEYYRKRLAAVLKPERAGTVVMPGLIVSDRMSLDLGGRKLELTAHPIAHTDNDLTAFDPQTGTLLASDLLFIQRIPSLDGSLRGWLKVLAALKAQRATKRAVPGHGPTGVDWPQATADLERYLGTLLRETREAIRKNIPIEEAVNVVGQSERRRWALFDDYHGGNVTQAFKELEWE